MSIMVGANSVNITPKTSQFLCGYPHVERYSEGIDTLLRSSSLYLDDGCTRMLIISNDLIFLDKATVAEIRNRISATTKINSANIMITCTHTHSGPLTVNSIARAYDSTVPERDPEYLAFIIDRISKGAIEATSTAVEAEIGLEKASSAKVGCNRRSPSGASNPIVPVLTARNATTHATIAVMMTVCVHPTILHQDSKLVSADFPGHARKWIKKELGDIPIIQHTGPAGNQSPRHIARANTVEEADRLGALLAESVLRGIKKTYYTTDIELKCSGSSMELPINNFPSPEDAERNNREKIAKLAAMREKNADPHETRTAECDWFGAERKVMLAKMKASGELEKLAKPHSMPAEVQMMRIGEWTFVAWPGEIFVEFALELMKKSQNTYAIAYANGETQGYLVTKEAVEEGGYEASIAIFKSPDSPEMLLKETLKLIGHDQN